MGLTGRRIAAITRWHYLSNVQESMPCSKQDMTVTGLINSAKEAGNFSTVHVSKNRAALAGRISIKGADSCARKFGWIVVQAFAPFPRRLRYDNQLVRRSSSTD